MLPTISACAILPAHCVQTGVQMEHARRTNISLFNLLCLIKRQYPQFCWAQGNEAYPSCLNISTIILLLFKHQGVHVQLPILERAQQLT